jgi:hypothetical protein
MTATIQDLSKFTNDVGNASKKIYQVTNLPKRTMGNIPPWFMPNAEWHCISYFYLREKYVNVHNSPVKTYFTEVSTQYRRFEHHHHGIHIHWAQQWRSEINDLPSLLSQKHHHQPLS